MVKPGSKVGVSIYLESIREQDYPLETYPQAGAGNVSPANDLTGDGVVNVLDAQTEINAILYGCPLYSVTPRCAVTTVTLMNQAVCPPPPLPA